MRALLLQFALFATALQVRAGQNTCDPKQVWEEMIMAKGGRARLEAVSAVHVVESFGRWYWPAWNKRLLLFPDFYWGLAKHGAPFSMRVTQLDLARGREWNCIEGGECKLSFPGTSNLVDWMQLVYLHETKWLKPKPVACVIRMEGNRQVTSLQVSVGQIQAEFLIPEGSRLPSALQFSRDVPLTHYRFDKYKSVNGVMMPSKMASGSKSDLFWCKMRYEINPKYDPEFRMADAIAPSAISDSEPWRPGRSRYYWVPRTYH